MITRLPASHPLRSVDPERLLCMRHLWLFSIAGPPHTLCVPFQAQCDCSPSLSSPKLSWFCVVGCRFPSVCLRSWGEAHRSLSFKGLHCFQNWSHTKDNGPEYPGAPWLPDEVSVDDPKERPSQEKGPEQLVQVDQQARTRARTGRRALSCLLPASATTFVCSEAKR